MVALLWANKIIALDKTFNDVPAGLKKQVAKELKLAGCEDLITEEQYK
ncbi:hypothetical protein SAMN02746066_03126 [Anaerosporobacter mobilis DSM 15930]|jgi:hypothetical protein|uniref:Uncharacterized protein n=1 Tax=Anaerosporobacter mobilis DSM 15930 TaxID=1120996 RepID=A0A1M7LBW2_9FIRM|nr:hypothetical protein [Anaerosporobacter mobilis]SHM74841.1 hypothetical protein SAMN02746066_03126 [Anaerosporobacter mobilis DSM 15930]